MGNLIEQLKAKAQGITPMPELKYIDNQPYYAELPPDFVQATLDDFLDHNGQPVNGIPYLIHSMHRENTFYAMRSTKGFLQRNDMLDFIAAKRVYVYKK